jgi:hypothetical protein
MTMRRTLTRTLAFGLALAAGGVACKSKTAYDEKHFNADANSGPDGQRQGANPLKPNTKITADVNFKAQNKTNWYAIDLRGKPGVLITHVHWDTAESDVMVDVFDSFGKQLSASPARNKGAKEKQLLTQIDKPGEYFIRVTAPTPNDGTVYTMEAKWEEPLAVAAPPVIPVLVTQPDPPPKPKREPKEPRETPPTPSGDTVEGRIVSAYRDGDALMLHLDKGSEAGLKPGASGNVLVGSAGQDFVEGGEIKVVKVIGGNKALARSGLRSLGRNNRVLINLGR